MNKFSIVSPDGITPLLSVSDVAKSLRISCQMVYKLVAIHELASIRIGKAIRFNPDDINAWIQIHSFNGRATT